MVHVIHGCYGIFQRSMMLIQFRPKTWGAWFHVASSWALLFTWVSIRYIYIRAKFSYDSQTRIFRAFWMYSPLPITVTTCLGRPKRRFGHFGRQKLPPPFR